MDNEGNGLVTCLVDLEDLSLDDVRSLTGAPLDRALARARDEAANPPPDVVAAFGSSL
jgi:FXSXX-COOH protein